ncbi:MAG TPA: agmatine deiminase family protein [Xanthomonadales bacterium]|nr:agmatine deiminase family protein [Xanthomonadales bacterium]
MSASKYRLPPEWMPQSAVLIAWPQATGDFSRWLSAVEDDYGAIAREISRREPLIVACQDDRHQVHVRECLVRHGAKVANLRLVNLPYDDIWVRDTAPLTVVDGARPRLLDFRFTGWGNKHSHAADARLAGQLAKSGVFAEADYQTLPLVLEGGSIEVDGQGSLLTTRHCLLNPNRNPELAQAEIETELKSLFGVERILWLEHGHIAGDDTDAHVDTLARFCSADTIAYTACTEPEDEHFEALAALHAQLETFRTADGRPYRLVGLPIPGAIFDEDGKRLPATYANFLVVNGAVLVPVYDDPADAVSLSRLAGCFPGREIVPVPCRGLIHQYGSLHCMSMQFPAALSLEVG